MKKVKKLVSITVSVAVIITMVCSATLSVSAASKWSGYKKVSTVSDLMKLHQSSDKFYLTNDIDLSGVDNWGSLNFRGTLDGNGYAVKHLKSTQGGLFYFLTNATVKNLGLYNVDINTNDKEAAALAYQISGKIVISNCYVTGTISSRLDSSRAASGFTAHEYILEDVKITNCLNMANVTSGGLATGIIGGCDNDVIFKNCINMGNITGTSDKDVANSNVGGITGLLDSTMTSCYNIGNVKNNNKGLKDGGIAGSVSNKALMINCATTTKHDFGIKGQSSKAKATTSVNKNEFKKESTYKGLDFGKNWTIHSKINNGYPVLSTMLKEYDASMPKASLKSGTYTGEQKIKLSTDIKGATIRYTRSGKNPSTGSKKYADEITINETTTIKAAIFVNGYRAKVVTLNYVIK